MNLHWLTYSVLLVNVVTVLGASIDKKETKQAAKKDPQLKQRLDEKDVPIRVINPKPIRNETFRLAPGSCRDSTLCCPGRIDGCITITLCYCDEFCMENGDCCMDYEDYCQGKFRCWEVDSIDGNPCNTVDPGATCTDSTEDPTKMTCNCSPGFVFDSGLNTCVAEVIVSDPCAAVTCGSGSTCQGGVCVCLDGYSQNEEGVCVEVVSDPCANVKCGFASSCQGGVCVCLDGYGMTGEGVCVKDPCANADESDSNPCNNHGDLSATCTSDYFSYSYTCSCTGGFVFLNGKCADPCAAADESDANPCNNNGDFGSICLPDFGMGTYTCTCSAGWVVNGGNCVDPCYLIDCGIGGSCSLGKCTCEPKYFLLDNKCHPDPCQDTDKLDGNPCNNNGDKGATCMSDYQTGTYSCLCSNGWAAPAGVCIDSCSINDILDDNPCNNLGDSQAVCYGVNGTYACACSLGWQFTEGSCAGACAFEDPVDRNPCNNDGDSCGKCVASGNGYSCECSPGFTFYNGKCVDVNECLQPLVCNDCGQCHNTEGSYFCVCGSGYKVSSDGKNCESMLGIWLNVLGKQ